MFRSFVIAGPPDITLLFFFFNDTATTEIYTLSLHDALPISLFENPKRKDIGPGRDRDVLFAVERVGHGQTIHRDRKSTRLNSSHDQISYAVFCLKKKNSKLNAFFSFQCWIPMSVCRCHDTRF